MRSRAQRRRGASASGLMGNRYLEKPAEVARYSKFVEYLYDFVLNPAESVKLVDQLPKDFITVRR